MLCAGKGAALVRFFTEPQRLFAAISAKAPLPPLSDRCFPVLFAPGLATLYRVAGNDEVAIWEKLARPTVVWKLSSDRHARHVIEQLFSIGAADPAPEGSPGAAMLTRKRG